MEMAGSSKSNLNLDPSTNIIQKDNTLFPRLYNQIILSLENSLLPETKLEQTPSRCDGVDAETEKDLRILGCELIQTAGILLKLPQVAMATAQVLFQRFFYCKSFVLHNMETVAMSCLCLASKIEEAQRRIRDVINVFHHLKQVRGQKEITPMIIDLYYTNLKNQVIKAERRVLKELGFCVHVKHPHKLIVMYLQVLKYEKNSQLMQMAWNFMNDSLRTDVFMRFHPETIACACIYLSARKLGIPLPTHPLPWYGIFHVAEDDIIDICYRVLELYTRKKPNADKLETIIDQLKKQHMESRNKTKEQNTPPAVTTVDRNDGSHNAWGGFIQRAIPPPLPNETKAADDKSESRSRSRGRSRSHSRSQSRTPRRTSRSRTVSRTRSISRSRSRSQSPRIHSHSRSRSRSASLKRYKKLRKDRQRSPSRSPPPIKLKKKYYSPSPENYSHTKSHKRKSSRDRDNDKYYSHRSKHHERAKYETAKHGHHHNASSSSKYINYSYRTSHRDYYHESSRNRKRR